MPAKNLRVVSYVRDLSLTAAKFDELDRLVREARKERVDAVVVASPRVLGDTYDELTTNLKKLGDAGLLLAFATSLPPDRN